MTNDPTRDYESFWDQTRRLQVLERSYECVGPGWRPILEALDNSIKNLIANKCWDKHHRGEPEPEVKIHVLQVKEKFGALRVYLSLEGLTREEADRVWNWVSFAEALSNRLCEECGLPGTPRAPHNSRFGWVLTLCEKHHAERDAKYRPLKGEDTPDPTTK